MLESSLWKIEYFLLMYQKSQSYLFKKYRDQHTCLHSKVSEFLRNFEFCNWHAMRGGLMLPDSISEEKLEID